jgi:hypothetical protein
MKFNRQDLDLELIHSRAFEEAKGIFESPSRARGRSLGQILDSCIQGQTAEVYLIQKHGFTSDPRKFNDTIDPNGVPTEQKTSTSVTGIHEAVEKCGRDKIIDYRKDNYPDLVYAFLVTKNTNYDVEYELYDIYKWNGTQFAPTLRAQKVVDIIEDPEYFVLNLPKKYDSDSIAKIFMYHKNQEKPWAVSMKPLKIIDGDKTVAIINSYEDLKNNYVISDIIRQFRPTLWLPTYALWKHSLMKLYDDRFAKCNNGTIKVEKELTYA